MCTKRNDRQTFGRMRLNWTTCNIRGHGVVSKIYFSYIYCNLATFIVISQYDWLSPLTCIALSEDEILLDSMLHKEHETMLLIQQLFTEIL